MLSLTYVLFLQDLDNYNLSKTAGSTYVAPGGPRSSPPFYRVHSNLTSTPTSPTSPSTTLNPLPSRFPPSFSAGGPSYPSTGGSGAYVDPKLLVNMCASDLPQGVDPGRKEVGSGLWVRFKLYNNMELIMCSLLIIVGMLQADGCVEKSQSSVIRGEEWLHQAFNYWYWLESV